MTDVNFCCLCASDEGVFLDIFTSTHRQLGNRSFVDELEACLSIKVDRERSLGTTICHRCAIELGQCNQFVENYHRTYSALSKRKKTNGERSCCFCLTTASNNCLFTLAKDFRSSVHPLQKIYECFNTKITRTEAERQSICLACRYNLDLLYDLRKLAREVKAKLQRLVKSKAILSSLPKTETLVVNRKTTIIRKSKLELENLSDSESEDETMARKGSRAKKAADPKPAPAALKSRTCGQCQTSIEGGIDMYRLHSTGVTVCKMCWITIDPFNNDKSNKRRRQNQADVQNTRLCTVFLKDVLTDPISSKENQGSPKVEREDPIYVISDNSEEEEIPLMKSMEDLRDRRSSRVHSSERERSSKSTRGAKRSLKQDESGGVSNKKLKSAKNEAVATMSLGLRRSIRNQSSDSDNVREKREARKSKNSPKYEEADSGDKLSKKRYKKNEGTSKESDKLKSDNSDKSQSEDPDKSKSEDSLSSFEHLGRTSRKVRNKVPLILEPISPPNSPKAQKNDRDGEPSTTPAAREIGAVSKNLANKSIAKNQPSSKAKHSPKRPKTLMTVSFPFKIRDPYECKVCKTEYRNKVIGMKHELTHYKQVEIKIEKLNVTHHFQTIDQNSRTTEIHDAGCLLGSPSTNEKPANQPTALEEPASKKDQDKELDLGKEEEEHLSPSGKPESGQQEDKSPDNDDTEMPEAASSTNGQLSGESASSPRDDSETKTAETKTAETDELKKINDSGKEADSVTEKDLIDSNGTTEEAPEKASENEIKESAEELEKTVNDIEEKKVEEDKSKETAVLPSTSGKDVDGDKELGEELESDTDIRIVDSGSSGDDSNEQTKKVATDEKIAKNVSAPKDFGLVDLVDEPTHSDDKTETLNDDRGAEIASKIDSVNDKDDKSLTNEEPSKIENAEGDGSEKIENSTPISAVTGVLEEVMALATAEVQKRFDSGVVSMPETLENISDEIKKTGEDSVVAATSAGDDPAKKKEVESNELDISSTTNTLENYLELSNTDA